MNRYRWVVLGAGAVGTGAVAALRTGLPALGPALRSAHGLSLTQVGLVFASVSVGIMLALVPWGILTDRVGERPVMAGGLAATSAALVGAAFAPGFGGVLAGLFLAGLLGASATGASGRAVMGWFARDERGFALGIRQTAIPIGGAVAALTLPALAAAGGLRAALLALAAACLVSAVVAGVLMRDSPPPPAFAAGYVAPPPTRDPRIWRLGIGSALLVLAQGALLGFLVLFLHDERGLSTGAAAGGLAAVQLLGAGARLVAGRRSDRIDRRIIPLRRNALATAALIGLTALLVAAPGLLLYPVLLVAGTVAMSWNGLAFTAAAEISGRARAGTAMSLQNTALAAAGSAAPVLFGALVQASSWRVGFVALALAPLAGWRVLAPLEAEEDDRAVERARRMAAARTPRRSCNATRAAHPVLAKESRA